MPILFFFLKSVIRARVHTVQEFTHSRKGIQTIPAKQCLYLKQANKELRDNVQHLEKQLAYVSCGTTTPTKTEDEVYDKQDTAIFKQLWTTKKEILEDCKRLSQESKDSKTDCVYPPEYIDNWHRAMSGEDKSANCDLNGSLYSPRPMSKCKSVIKMKQFFARSATCKRTCWKKFLET